MNTYGYNELGGALLFGRDSCISGGFDYNMPGGGLSVLPDMRYGEVPGGGLFLLLASRKRREGARALTRR